jgi:di/tricarboxylate transporter
LTFDVIILLIIVTAAFILFIGGWLRVDLVGLLVLSALALTGLVVFLIASMLPLGNAIENTGAAQN